MPRIWRSTRPVDLLLSNACFHWVEDHAALLDHLLPQLADGGTFAFQVPANHDAPSHNLLRDLCSSERWREQLEVTPEPVSGPPAGTSTNCGNQVSR